MKKLFPVYLTYFLDNFGLALIYPIFTPILQNSQTLFGAHRTLLFVLLITISPTAMFFGAPFLGQFSDRFGRKKAFYFTILGTTIGYALTAISLMHNTLSLLFVSRLLTGLFASNLTLCLAAIVDCSKSSTDRTRHFGTIATLGGLSFILAIALSRYLSNVEPSTPFWITAGINALNFLYMVTLFHETHQRKPPAKIHPLKGMYRLFSLILDKHLLLIYGANFLFLFAWLASINGYSKLLKRHYMLSPEQITHSFILCGVLWAISNFVINPWLAQRFFPGKTLRVCLLFLSLLFFCLAFANSLSVFLILFYLATCLAALCWTNSIATLSLKAPENVQGSILGFNQAVSSLASMAAPACGFLVGADASLYVLTGLASLLALLFLRRFAKNPAL